MASSRGSTRVTRTRHLERVDERFRRLPPHGYWLVGSDGGIFTFGSAQFYGSTGSLNLQRPVVGIVPTADRRRLLARRLRRRGLQLRRHAVLRLHPGSGSPSGRLGPAQQPQRAHRRHGADRRRRRLLHGGLRRRGLRVRRRQVRGVVPRHRRLLGHGGGGHARRQRQRLLAGDLDRERLHLRRRPLLRRPGAAVLAITSAVRTPDGQGYWILDADGQVFPYGDAGSLGSVARRPLGRAQPGHGHLRHLGRRRLLGGLGRWERSSTSATPPTTGAWSGRTSTGRSSRPPGSDGDDRATACSRSPAEEAPGTPARLQAGTRPGRTPS